MTGKMFIAGMTLMAAAGAFSHAQALHHRDSASQPGGAAAPAAVSLTETHWNLIELDGNPVTASNESQPYIYLQVQGDKLSGSGGCNRLFGSFDLSGSSLQFHSVAATMMACPGDAMKYESQLADALRLTTGFQISGEVLSLRVDDRVLAQFQPEKQK